jgi:hypothetical protein
MDYTLHKNGSDTETAYARVCNNNGAVEQRRISAANDQESFGASSTAAIARYKYSENPSVTPLSLLLQSLPFPGRIIMAFQNER